MSTLYMDLAAKTYESGEAVAGVVFKQRFTAGENETFYKYETFKVASLYSAKESSKFRYIVQTIWQMMDELPQGTEAVVIRSSASQFTQYKRFARTFNRAPIKVVTLYYKRLEAIENDAFILCEDAMDRKASIVADI